jgi:hypothetical protein
MSIDAAFAQFFDDIPDPRQHAKIYYPWRCFPNQSDLN